MDAVPTLRSFGVTCGILGIIQSTIWIIISIVDILVYACIIPVDLTEGITDPKKLDSPYLYFLYTRYLKNDACNNTMEILPKTEAIYLIQPNILFIWVCIYLGVSVVWLVLSILLIITFAQKLMRFLNTSVFLWIIIAIEMCGMDFVLTVLFGLDFQQIQTHYTGDYKFEAEIASITMIVIFSKGFVLWILNFILIIMLFYCIMNVPKNSDRSNIIRKSLDSDNETIFSTFTKSAYRNHPSQWQPPIDAFTYSNNNLGPPVQLLSSPKMRDYHGSHLGWTLRRDGTKQRRHSPYSENVSDDMFVHIPTPDYTPVLPRARRGPQQIHKLDRTIF